MLVAGIEPRTSWSWDSLVDNCSQVASVMSNVATSKCPPQAYVLATLISLFHHLDTSSGFNCFGLVVSRVMLGMRSAGFISRYPQTFLRRTCRSKICSTVCAIRKRKEEKYEKINRSYSALTSKVNIVFGNLKHTSIASAQMSKYS